MKRPDILYQLLPQRFFVYAALIIGLAYNLITPPLQAPDEFNHFYRAWQIADGHFLPERTPHRLGGNIPTSLTAFALPYFYAATNLNYNLDKEKIMHSSEVAFSDTPFVFKDFPNTAYYAPISYLPQALGIFVAKQFKCSVFIIYYAGRLSAFLFWLIIMFNVIKIVPHFKWLFTVLVLLPMDLYVTSSFSADTVTNCFSFLFISLVLKHTFNKNNLKIKDLLALLFLAVLMSFAKVVYVGLVFLLFLIPSVSFKGQFRRFAALAVIGVCCLCSVFLWSSVIMDYYITFPEYDPAHTYYIGISTCGDYYAQKHYILNHGFYFLKVIWRSVINHPWQHLSSYIGVFGQLDIPMSSFSTIISLCFISFLALSEPQPFIFRFSQKVIILLSVILSSVLLILSQHLIWDCVGEGIVDFIQGRYLIPLFPLLFILIGYSKFRMQVAPVIMISLFIFSINFYSCVLIYNRFYSERLSVKQSFTCDFEKKNERGFFITSDPHIQLGGGFRDSSQAISGRFSGLLTPPSASGTEFGFGFRFNTLKPGDLIEVEALQKGLGNLVISGADSACKNFYMSGSSYAPSQRPDWTRVFLVFTVYEKYDKCNFSFYVWNPSPEKLLIDDLKFSIKSVTSKD